MNSGPPSFAEELAKRLGSVLPSQKTVVTQEADDSSINNRSKGIKTITFLLKTLCL